MTFPPTRKDGFLSFLDTDTERETRTDEIDAMEYLEHRSVEEERREKAPYKKGVVHALHLLFMQRQHNEATVLLRKKIFVRDALRGSGRPLSGAFVVHAIRQHEIDVLATSDMLVILFGSPLDSELKEIAGDAIEIGVTFDTHITYIV